MGSDTAEIRRAPLLSNSEKAGCSPDSSLWKWDAIKGKENSIVTNRSGKRENPIDSSVSGRGAALATKKM